VLKKNLLTAAACHVSGERLWRHGALHHLIGGAKGATPLQRL